MLKGGTCDEKIDDIDDFDDFEFQSPSDMSWERYGLDDNAPSSSLVTISLNTQGPELVQSLLEQIASISDKKQRISLHLVCVELTDDTFRLLESILQDERIVELILDSNNLTASSVQFLCNILSNKTSSLLSLSFNENPIKDEGIVYLTQMLQHFKQNDHSLESLSLNNCQITSEGIKPLLDELQQSCSLKELRLNSNPIADATPAIAKLLAHNSTLVLLELNSTQMTFEQGLFLAEALKTNSCLSTLNIDSNKFDSEGKTEEDFARCFFEEIQYNNALWKYFGPDQGGRIQCLCNRNLSMRYNNPNCMQVAPSPTAEDREKILISDTFPSTVPSLLFLALKTYCTSNQNTTGVPTPSKEITQRVYQEACRENSKMGNPTK